MYLRYLPIYKVRAANTAVAAPGPAVKPHQRWRPGPIAGFICEDTQTMNDPTELNMLISGVIDKEGEKKACIYFSEGERFAEGYVPDCKITSQKGFSEEEIAKLEEYLFENLASIKRTAAGINPIKAMMKD